MDLKTDFRYLPPFPSYGALTFVFVKPIPNHSTFAVNTPPLGGRSSVNNGPSEPFDRSPRSSGPLDWIYEEIFGLSDGRGEPWLSPGAKVGQIW